VRDGSSLLVFMVCVPAERPLDADVAALSLASDTTAHRFWSALSCAKLDGTVLSLPEGVTWFGDSLNTRRMYVRTCYPPLYERVVLEKRSVLLGTPGIGKSMFGLYFLWRLLQKRHRVVYQSAGGQCVVLNPGAQPLLYAQGSPRVLELLLRDETFYVVDGRPPEEGLCSTLLITSPKRAVWGKWVTHTSATLLYAPVFSLTELLLCRACCYVGVPEALLLSLYNRWGGSARFTLGQSDEQQQERLTRELSSSLCSCDLTTTFNAICSADCGADDVPHRLVHMLEVSPDFAAFKLGFASDYMRDRVLMELSSRGKAAVRNFIRAS
jgi:hypothetical protein